MSFAPRHPKVLWIIPAVYLVFLTAEFAAITHITLALTAAGRSTVEVGVFAAALWLGILLASARAQSLVSRHGHARALVGATALSALGLLSMAGHSHYGGWWAGAFVLGLGGGVVWVAGEAWLTETAPAAQRGFFVGLFETSVGLGLMAGPALVPLTRALHWPTLWVSVALIGLALAIVATLLRLPRPAAATPTHPQNVAATAQAAAEAAQAQATLGALMLQLVGISALSGLMESGVSSLFPSISMRVGFSLDAAAWLGTVIGAGSALLQPPAGLLADRLGTRRVTLACWAIVWLVTLLLWQQAAQPHAVLWGVGFVLGGVGGAVYTLLIIEMGHRLRGAMLVKAISVLVMSYAIGTAVGPVWGGWVFDHFGLLGTATLLALLSALGLALSWFTLRPVAATASTAESAATLAQRD